MLKRWMTLVAMLLLMLAVVACGVAAPADEGPGEELLPTETAAPEATATPEESSRGLPEMDETQAEIAVKAMAHLSAQSGLAEESMQVVEVEEVEWPNSALGCPQPDQMYMEVITPGFRVVVEADGESYNLHTDQEGQTIILCDEEAAGAGEGGRDITEADVITDTEASEDDTMADTEESGEVRGLDELSGTTAEMANRALQFLLNETGLSAADVSFVEFDEVVWSDSSLGCPKPGEMYLQVLTPGFRVVFQSGEQKFFVHSNESGDYMVLCDKMVPLPSNPSPDA